MKSEHRHELRTNELQKLTERAIPLAKHYGVQILAAVGVVILIIVGVFWWQSSKVNTKAEYTSLLAPANSAEQYAEAGDNIGSGPLRDAAYLQAAQRYLVSAHELYFEDRESAKRDLEKAEELFQKVLESDPLPALRENAMYGLATAKEYLNEGDPAEAIEAYQALRDAFPATAYLPVVEDKLTELKKKSVQGFYAWNAKQNPEPGSIKPPLDQALNAPTSTPQIPDMLRMDGIIEEEPQSPLVPPTPELLPPSVSPGTPQPFPTEDPQPETPTIPDPNPQPENPTPENPTPENPTTPEPQPENPSPETPTTPEPQPENPSPETPTPEPSVEPTPEEPSNPAPEPTTTPEPEQTPEPVSPPENF